MASLLRHRLSRIVLLKLLVASVAAVSTPPPSPASGNQYLELQLYVRGNGTVEELSAITTKCLEGYSHSSVESSDGCSDDAKDLAPSAGLAPTGQKCTTLTLFLVESNVPSTPASQTSSQVSTVLSCLQAGATREDTFDFNLAGVGFAESLPSTEDNSLIEYVGDWQECSASCGGGTQERSLVCFAEQGLLARELRQCSGFPALPLTQACSASDCTSGVRWEYGPWSSCSQNCGGGWATRAAKCTQLAAVLPGSISACASGAPGQLQKPCNAQACDLYTWQIGEWGECSTDCNGGDRVREVNCTAPVGVEVDPSLCEQPAPASVEECNVEPCDVCSANRCSSHGICVLDYCNCIPSYYGGSCEVPLGCASGVGDVFAQCCPSGLLNAQGVCCPVGSRLDGEGQCCQLGGVDACGRCGGNATAVDATGACCDAALDAQGVCCSESLDECGVCGGVGSSCALAVDVTVELTAAPSLNSTSKTAAAGNFTLQLTSVLSSGLLVPSKDITISASSSQQGGTLQAAQISLAVLVLPSSSESSGSSVTIPAAQRLLAWMNGSTWVQNGDLLWNPAVNQIWRTGVCGNGVCEVGEREWKGAMGPACPQDCPLPYVPCSTSVGQACGGHGRCFSSSGGCNCFRGYTGAACESCQPGWAAKGNGSCQPYAPDLLLINPALGARPPPPNPPPPPPLPPPPILLFQGAPIPAPDLGAAAADWPGTPGWDFSPSQLVSSAAAEDVVDSLEQSAAVSIGGSPDSIQSPKEIGPEGTPAEATGQLRGNVVPGASPDPQAAGSSRARTSFGSNVGEIVGLGVAVVAILCACLGLAIWLIRRGIFRQKAKSLADAWQSGSSRGASGECSPASSEQMGLGKAGSAPASSERAVTGSTRPQVADLELGYQSRQQSCSRETSCTKSLQEGLRVWRLSEASGGAVPSRPSSSASPVCLRKLYAATGPASAESAETSTRGVIQTGTPGSTAAREELCWAQASPIGYSALQDHFDKLPKRPALFPELHHEAAEVGAKQRRQCSKTAEAPPGDWNVIDSPVFAPALEEPEAWVFSSPLQPLRREQHCRAGSKSSRFQLRRDAKENVPAGRYSKGDARPVREPKAQADSQLQEKPTDFDQVFQRYRESSLQWDSISPSASAAVAVPFSSSSASQEEGKQGYILQPCENRLSNSALAGRASEQTLEASLKSLHLYNTQNPPTLATGFFVRPDFGDLLSSSLEASEVETGEGEPSPVPADLE